MQLFVNTTSKAIIAMSVLMPSYALALIGLSDPELSTVSGQSLLTVSSETSLADPTIKMTKVNINGTLELNANIKKLVLGKGGDNGATGADIDFDNVSISGDCPVRPQCSAKFINPSIEIAIKNPNNVASREVVGFRFTSDGTEGLMTIGTENSNTPNGINSFSGYMSMQSDSSGLLKGNLTSKAGFLDTAKYPLTGKMVAIGLTTVNYKTVGSSSGAPVGFYMPSVSNITFEKPAFIANKSRITQISLTDVPLSFPKFYVGNDANPSDNPAGAMGSFPASGVHDVANNQIRTQGGPLTAEVVGCSSPIVLDCLALAQNGRRFENVKMFGTMDGLKARATLNEPLGMLHRFPLSSPLYFSFQKQNLKWNHTNTEDIAQKGWWMSVKDPMNVGVLAPTQQLDLCPTDGSSTCLYPEFAAKLSQVITANPAQTSDLLGILTGNGLRVDIGNVDLASAGTITMTANKIQLANQSFTPNCYGGRTFC